MRLTSSAGDRLVKEDYSFLKKSIKIKSLVFNYLAVDNLLVLFFTNVLINLVIYDIFKLPQMYVVMNI